MAWEHSDEHETTHVRVDEQGVHFDVFETNGPHFAGGCSLEEFVPGREHYQRALRLFGQATAQEIALEACCALEAVRRKENAPRSTTPIATCAVCAPVGGRAHADMRAGQTLPAYDQLEPIRPQKGVVFANELRRCPSCGCVFAYEYEYDYSPNGSDEDATLLRLTPAEAIRALASWAPEEKARSESAFMAAQSELETLLDDARLGPWAARGLAQGRLGARDVEGVLRLISDARPPIRHGAVEALSWLDPADPALAPILPVCVKLLSDKQAAFAARRALEELRVNPKAFFIDAVDALTSAEDGAQAGYLLIDWCKALKGAAPPQLDARVPALADALKRFDVKPLTSEYSVEGVCAALRLAAAKDAARVLQELDRADARGRYALKLRKRLGRTG
jgi:hypothetical protein